MNLMDRSNQDRHEAFLRCNDGFTLVELSLSLVFISILSLAVVLVIANAVSAYHKSLTLNQIDTVGTNLVDDMRSAVQDSPASNLIALCDRLNDANGKMAKTECIRDQARKFVNITAFADVALVAGDEAMRNTPVFGALCTGSYSYLWNSGYFFNGKSVIGNGAGVSPASLKYATASNETKTISNFRLLKVKDRSRAVCAAAVRVSGGRVEDIYNRTDAISSLFDISLQDLVTRGERVIVDEEPTELLKANDGATDSGLALYDLSTFTAEDSFSRKNLYYYTSFILGSVQGGINITGDGNYCSTPESYNGLENFDYCAINKFNFAALATGELK